MTFGEQMRAVLGYAWADFTSAAVPAALLTVGVLVGVVLSRWARRR